jgi:hypothetical protein
MADLSQIKEKLWKCYEKASTTRVGEEMHNLMGRAYSKLIFYTLGRALLDTALIAAALYAVYRALMALGLAQAVVTYCALALTLFLASAASTRCKKERRFQHSALVTAMLFICSTCLGSALEWGILQDLASLLAIMLLMFFGYRFALR